MVAHCRFVCGIEESALTSIGPDKGGDPETTTKNLLKFHENRVARPKNSQTVSRELRTKSTKSWGCCRPYWPGPLFWLALQ